jgi:hypothetical protein
MPASPRIAAGFDRIFWGVVNTNGFVIGYDTTGAVAGNISGQGLRRLEGARTLPVGVPEDEIVTVTGDNEPKTSFKFPSADLPSGVLETAVRDLDFEALVQGTRVETVGDMSVGTLAPSGSTNPDICLLLMRKAKKMGPGVRGVSAWEILFIPRCSITPLGAELTERQFNPYRYSINISKSDRLPWGATFTTALHGTTDVALVPVESDNPVMLHTHIGDASRVLFNLAIVPKTNAKVNIYENGVKQTVTTDYTQNGVATTHTGAPASGVIVNTFYEVDESDLP